MKRIISLLLAVFTLTIFLYGCSHKIERGTYITTDDVVQIYTNEDINISFQKT